ncbi:MAG TPA: hypothetical protein VK466_15325 [Terriglobales bacterium]|nr:hypothetical protein [Terriglobales bacterium]
MHALILFAALQGFISIPPIRILQPYHDVKCPRGYSIWWPAGNEFDDDRYAECIKSLPKPVAKKSTPNTSRPAATNPNLTTPVSLIHKTQRPGR